MTETEFYLICSRSGWLFEKVYREGKIVFRIVNRKSLLEGYSISDLVTQLLKK